MVRLAKAASEKSQSITYERYKLFNRSQKTGGPLEVFHAALTAQAANSAVDTLENELVRDFPALQDTLMFETLPPEEILKRALKFEQSKQTTQSFQKSNMNTVSTKSGSQIKTKKEPILAVGNRGQTKKRVNRDRFKRRQPEGRTTSSIITTRKRKHAVDMENHFEKGILKNVPQWVNNARTARN